MRIYIYSPILHKYPLIFSYVKYTFIAYRLTRLAPCQARLVRSAAGAVEAELGQAESQMQKMHGIFSPNLLHDMCRKIISGTLRGRMLWMQVVNSQIAADCLNHDNLSSLKGWLCLPGSHLWHLFSLKEIQRIYIIYMHLGIRKLWPRALIFSYLRKDGWYTCFFPAIQLRLSGPHCLCKCLCLQCVMFRHFNHDHMSYLAMIYH